MLNGMVTSIRCRCSWQKGVNGKGALNKRFSLLISAGAALIFALSSPASAQGQWAVEIDPATFLLEGYSLHGRYSPEAFPNWRVGLGVYSLEFPDALVDLNSDNRDQGWELDLHQGTGLFVERYFNGSNSGWFVGTQLANHAFVLENPRLDPDDSAEFSNILIMPYGGYLHRLSDKFYLQAWLGAGYTEKVEGRTEIADEKYDVDPLFSFTALHLGYQL